MYKILDFIRWALTKAKRDSIEESVKQAHKRISELKGIKGDPV